MSWEEPLNLQYWLINTLSESVEIFVFLAFIAIAVLSAKFKMPNYIFMIMFVLFIVIVNHFLELGAIYILTILLVGMITFYALSKMWE